MGNKPIYNFSPEKNAWLIEVRGISFEEIIAALEAQKVLDIVEHPNSTKYAHQKMYIVELRDYVYLVPFVKESNKIFLKTAFPSRKATKQYLDE
jgi:hypothetical protein